jgi:hypothetical protein
MMNEAESLNSNPAQQQESDSKNAEETIEEPATIRDLVTLQQQSQVMDDDDRSPTKTERPIPLSVMMKALEQTAPNEETSVIRKPLSPES